MMYTCYACGYELTARVMYELNGKIVLDPCQHCTDEYYDQGYRDGKEDCILHYTHQRNIGRCNEYNG